MLGVKPKVRIAREIWPGIIAALLAALLISIDSCPAGGNVWGTESGEVEHGMGGPYEEALPALADSVASELDAALAGVPEPLEYSKPQMLLFTAYTIQPGDTIGQVALNFGLNSDSLLSLNNIKNSRLLQIGQVLKVPNQDGILYTVKNGDTLGSVAAKYEIAPAAIQTANELFSESIRSGSSLFIPGARLEPANLQEINGDLFIWPTSGFITSSYGNRSSPFTGIRQFHTGIDIGCPIGTAVWAALAGRVSSIGYDSTLGNHIVITHHSGYRTLYAHLSVVRVKSGAYVKAGDRIADSGNTGLSTGPHLHFTVYKNGVTVNPRALLR
ncbi:MAG: M23 family metallopeptidase [Treponema sp.]|jgi:murein DD-endopeptidase MepM/ murein hydrolase activator NlpD|nr:M23 family metallopeptidase [Treponema sp.]